MLLLGDMNIFWELETKGLIIHNNIVHTIKKKISFVLFEKIGATIFGEF